MEKYDLLVLGGGAGGLVTAAGAASLGAKVALIDKNELGGDCLWSGCVPTKSLIHSAKQVQAARRAADFQLEVRGKPDFSLAHQRLHQAIQTIRTHDDPNRFRKMGVDVYQGAGVFQSPHEIQTGDDRRIWGKRIVIATGSRPVVPKIEGLEESGYLTNESALQLKVLPSSLLIAGGGPIGLEFAQVFARFGVEVTVVEMAPDILIREDPELIPYVKRALKREGIQFLTKTKVTGVQEKGSRKEITVDQDGSVRKFTVDEVMIAAGRKPNTETLQLDRAGVRTERGAIQVNPYLQTSRRHIYAIGDVIGRFPFTHAAGYEGKTVVAHAVLGLRRKVTYDHLPWVTYTDPEVFHMGLTESEAREKYGKIRVYKTDLSQVDRFVTEHAAEGLIKIVTNRKGTILGAHAVGPGAGDWMQEVVFAARYGHKIGDLSQAVVPYPSRAAAVQQTADQYWRETLFSGWLPKLTKRYLRWFR
ncbi:pyruvate/2-oxoglutarate dehydrogenase complex dihydrolipoamide dehydrogenase (E3) component [Melghirimyces profundicolus]|uniref:Pyruvate/2-oxoglutarate dehydrogenase complex dihydrolipoamide dehydrogenase (E3) component n=1 Tax=Melghirimyces profundicolus TaxID=1242148 RepID=A0A2T6C8T8_9BACL|nr:FAD-dependent oxidoreductase [Melghirimyces profundicolus]PTX64725.1 pyruvate/2-oxoglutarate dehydrogenase complex dihydrolipoamide dehydrogenase (E3) component [Melghirimyces profundicolus]